MTPKALIKTFTRGRLIASFFISKKIRCLDFLSLMLASLKSGGTIAAQILTPDAPSKVFLKREEFRLLGRLGFSPTLQIKILPQFLKILKSDETLLNRPWESPKILAKILVGSMMQWVFQAAHLMYLRFWVLTLSMCRHFRNKMSLLKPESSNLFGNQIWKLLQKVIHFWFRCLKIGPWPQTQAPLLMNQFSKQTKLTQVV